MSDKVEGIGFHTDERKWDREEVSIYKTVTVNPHAEFAMKMISHFAVVAAEPDDEDSAGRSKVRRQTAEELVQFACDVADKAFAAFRDRNWLLDLPEPQMRPEKEDAA